jgi:hypothetical protein
LIFLFSYFFCEVFHLYVTYLIDINRHRNISARKSKPHSIAHYNLIITILLIIKHKETTCHVIFSFRHVSNDDNGTKQQPRLNYFGKCDITLRLLNKQFINHSLAKSFTIFSSSFTTSSSTSWEEISKACKNQFQSFEITATIFLIKYSDTYICIHLIFMHLYFMLWNSPSCLFQLLQYRRPSRAL